MSNMFSPKLQAQVYDILPSATAVFSYAIGSSKLSADEQFFVGAQTEVNLLQTTQIISDVCFITDHVAYASSNKTEVLFYPGGCVPCHYVGAWALGCFHSLISQYPNSKYWFTTSFLQPLPYLAMPLGPENCQLTSNFCWCSNSSTFVKTTQIISHVCFINDHVAYASSNKTTIV